MQPVNYFRAVICNACGEGLLQAIKSCSMNTLDKEDMVSPDVSMNLKSKSENCKKNTEL